MGTLSFDYDIPVYRINTLKVYTPNLNKARWMSLHGECEKFNFCVMD